MCTDATLAKVKANSFEYKVKNVNSDDVRASLSVDGPNAKFNCNMSTNGKV